MTTKVECPVCKGRGQTKKSSTEFHFEKLADGTRQHVTDKLGSGCLSCHGTGTVSDG